MVPIRIGLIGAGRIGQVHAQNLVQRIPTAQLVAVASSYEQAANDLAKRCNIEMVTGDYRQILDDPEINAVLICTVTERHTQIIEDAAQAGKHIFCEKPIGLTLDSIDRALETVERAGVILQIGFNRRFDANYRRIHQANLRGEIGRPEILHIISRDPAPPNPASIKDSGGIFFDMTIHDFDMARFLVGSDVEEIYVSGGVMIDPAIGAAGDLDTLIAVLKFKNGVIGTIENIRRAVYGYDQRAEMHGSAGAIRIDNNYPNNALISTAQSIACDLPLNFFMDRYTESFVAELQSFIDTIVHTAAPPITGQDGRAAVILALAARKSYDERRPVQISEIAPNRT